MDTPAVKREAEEEWRKRGRRWPRSELTSLSASIPGRLTAKASWSTSPASRTTSLTLATFRAACERWPGTPITLRQGARVIEDSRRLRVAWSDKGRQGGR